MEPGEEFLARLSPYTGTVTEVKPTERGFGTDLTAVVESERGRFFIKAMRNRPGGRREQMLREKLINPFVRQLAPALLWSIEDDEYIVLGFEHVQGRSADFLPGSPDLPATVGLVDRLGRLGVPEPARDWCEDRWDWWANEGESALFAGGSLLHTDINPSNILIGRNRAWIVDWSWPTRGAAFIDPALLVAQLVAADHSPGDAEGWVAGCPAWKNADSRAIDAFVLAYVRMTRVRALRRSSETWLTAMADAIDRWAVHRGVATDI
ncbi:protein kinase [Streptomyces sp. IF17]|nr:protein kinase [Streptomyces alkaliphilus]